MTSYEDERLGQHPFHLPRSLAKYRGLGALVAPPENQSRYLSIIFGGAENQGPRATMEDRCMAVIDMNATLAFPESAPPHAFFGVYDGHNGEACSEMLQRRLHVNIAKVPEFWDDPVAALVRGFVKTDEVFLKKQEVEERSNREEINEAVLAGRDPPPEFKFSGSTAVALLAKREVVPRLDSRDDSTCTDDSDADDEAYGSDEGEFEGEEDVEAGLASGRLVHALRLYFAHVGDARAVLSHGGVALDMTTDHKASTRPDEVARIKAAGGWVHNGRLHGVLAVSRAFGDAEHKTLKERFWEHSFTADPLIVEPDIRVHTVRPRDEVRCRCELLSAAAA